MSCKQCGDECYCGRSAGVERPVCWDDWKTDAMAEEEEDE